MKLSVRIVAALACLWAPLAHADKIKELAKELVKLRNEVETLNSDLETKKQAIKDEMRATAMRKADLETTIQRERIKVKKQKEVIAKKQELLGDAVDKAEDLVPMIEASMERMQVMIQQSLPFKTKDRLRELNKLKNQLSSGDVKPSKVLSQYWALVEDELRLRKESGLYRQLISLEGEETLAEVARIGMVAMFFNTGDQYGKVIRAGDSFEYVYLTNKDEIDSTRNIFTALKKNIRVGEFVVPNAFVAERKI